MSLGRANTSTLTTMPEARNPTPTLTRQTLAGRGHALRVGFPVSGFGFRASGLAFRFLVLCFRVSALCFRCSVVSLQFSGLGPENRGSGGTRRRAGSGPGFGFPLLVKLTEVPLLF